jgi:Sensors of blue-light using FAD
MSPLIHLIYASAASRPMGAHELGALLARARSRNAELGLTGMLLYDQGSFFQVLEGPPDVVEALYLKIERDPRHTEITCIIREPIPRRCFGAWSMGFANLSDANELAHAPGANDFFGQAQSFNDVSYGRAKKLLSAFAHGRWRSRCPEPMA